MHRGVTAATKGKKKGGSDLPSAPDGFVTSMAPWLDAARLQLSALQASLYLLWIWLYLLWRCRPRSTYYEYGYTYYGAAGLARAP